MIFLVDPTCPELFQRDLFQKSLRGDFYIMVQGPASPTRVEQIKSMFASEPCTPKVVFVKEFTRELINKFAFQKAEHPDNIADMRPTALMRHTHLLPPHVSRVIIRSTPFDVNVRELIPKLILDTITFLVQGLTISDEYVLLKKIQNKFEEELLIELDPVGELDTAVHCRWSKPEDHIRVRTDPSGEFTWPVDRKTIEKVSDVLDRISFGDLVHLADHDEINVEAVDASGYNESAPALVLLPTEVRRFIATRADTNQSFRTETVQTCPEVNFARDISGTLERPDGPVDLFIEARTDVRIQVAVLQEIFPTLAAGGMIYLSNPGMEITVMLSTWNTSMPLGSLYGNLGAAFDAFDSFKVYEDGTVGVYRKTITD